MWSRKFEFKKLVIDPFRKLVAVTKELKRNLRNTFSSDQTGCHCTLSSWWSTVLAKARDIDSDVWHVVLLVTSTPSVGVW
jgi:hypothetical protein